MNRYLLEIGVEEFPAGYVKGMIQQLEDYFASALADNQVLFESIRVESTPRRFAVLIEGLDQEAEESFEEVRGPGVKIAYQDGQASKALLGFLRGQGASEEDIQIKDYKGEEYVFVNKKIIAKPIDQVLVDEVPEIISKLNSPKTMRWGGKNLRFARPIRYFLSLYNDEVLSFDLEGIKVGNTTKGHRDLGKDEIVVDKIENYKSLLRENGVILERAERRAIIESESIKLAEENGGQLLYTEDLMNELADINEYPTPLIGNFDDKYLSLPKEVIVTVMVDHQRCFAIGDGEGKLLAKFIAVRNGDRKGIDNVRQGNEKVIEPRLSDGEFFYNEDLKKDLESFLPRLKTASYHENLGSIYDKSQRLIKLSGLIAAQLAVCEEVEANVKRAAELSKADLVTNMVVEFTELQGTMGRIYALESGEKSQVAHAIEEQYMPVRSDGDLPESTAGMILSLADKLDSICSMYAAGLRVTGSQDPFALRRAALGIINIILDKNLDLSLEGLVKDSLYTVLEDQGLVFDYEEVKGAIMDFFKVRYKTLLVDSGYSYDIVDAVLNTDHVNIFRMRNKIIAVGDFLKDESMSLDPITRIANITKDHIATNIDPSLLEAAEEKVLYSRLDLLKEIDLMIGRADYREALEAFGGLEADLNAFFDNVMVMVDDEAMKNNRLSLLKTYYKTISKIFIASYIVKE